MIARIQTAAVRTKANLIKEARGTSEQPRNQREDKFNHFTLTLLWSFLGQPSHPQAIDLLLQTKNQDTPMRGLIWQEIYNLYNDLDLNHALRYIHQLGVK